MDGIICGALNQPSYLLYSTIAASLIHIPVSYLLAVKYKLGFMGICIATFIHFNLRRVLNKAMLVSDPEISKANVSFFEAESHNWQAIKKLVRLSPSEFLSQVLGWWVFDLLTQMSALCGERALAS